jgi:hypothetical protein
MVMNVEFCTTTKQNMGCRERKKIKLGEGKDFYSMDSIYIHI